MTSATRPDASTPPAFARRPVRRPALWAFALAGCGAAVGCETAGQRLASFRSLRSPSAATLSDDPFNAAETAMASTSKEDSPLAEGRVSLDNPVRTASVDVTRTVARPGGVTRVDAGVATATPPGRWMAGEGTDDGAAVVRTSGEAGAGMVTLAGGAFAATDGPRVTPLTADSATAAPQPTAPQPAARARATASAAAARPAKTQPAPAETVDWRAEMDAFATNAAASATKSVTPADAPATSESTPEPKSVTPVAESEGRSEETVETIDRDSLPSAPLWNPTADAAPVAEAAAEPSPAAGDPIDAARPTTAQPPGGGWHSRKTEEIDPFAGF